VLADTGRPSGSAVNLLNAGWAITTAAPVDDGSWTIPEQAVVVFLEVDWSECNKALGVALELFDDDGQPASLFVDGQLRPAKIESDVYVPPVPGAPNGTPGAASFMVGVEAGVIRLSAPRRRYIWRLTVGGTELATVGFWVHQQPVASPPRIGGT